MAPVIFLEQHHGSARGTDTGGVMGKHMGSDSCSSARFEVSPYNPRARRRPGGVWNEDALPVTEWEAAEHRVVLPASMLVILELDISVLRWDREKYETVFREHVNDRHVIQDVSRYLNDWIHYGEEKNRPNNIRILFQDESGRWYAASIGPRQDGYTFITVFGSNDHKFLRNRLAGLKYVVTRKK